MDGVVIDSEKLHLRAMGLTLDLYGINYTQDFLNEYIGRSDEFFFEYVYKNMDNSHSIEEMLMEKNAFFEKLLPKLEYVGDFTDFISKVKSLKLQTGLVTSSSLFTVNKVNKLLNHTSHFDTVVTAEDTLKHKPDPDPYLLAIERLNADIESTLIVEDSINGVRAGKAAGCVVAGLTSSHSSETLQRAGADYVINSFSEISNFTTIPTCYKVL